MNLASRLFFPLFLHPFFILVIAFIVGIFIQLTFSPLIFISLAPALIGAIFYFYPGALAEWRMFIFCALCGFSLGSYRLHEQRKHQNTIIQELCNKEIDCVGYISDLQISHDRKVKNRITLEIRHYRPVGTQEWIPIEAAIFLYSRRPPTDCAVGDTIQLDSITFKHGNSNPAFNNYLLKEGICATAFAQQATFKIVAQPAWGVRNWLHQQRVGLVDRLRNRFSHATLALFTSLFLGNRTEEKQEQEIIAQQSKNWGTSHHLARSGLHLVIFIYLLASLLRFLPMSLFAKEILLLTLCIIYHLFSWSSVSFLRAFITFLFYKTCTLLKFPSHVLHILTLACGLILFTNPMQLFFLDFQLSFGLTFTLAWFNAAYRGKHTQ